MTVERTRDPGLRWVVSCWSDHLWHWAKYVPCGDGLVDRFAGVEATKEAALERVA